MVLREEQLARHGNAVALELGLDEITTDVRDGLTRCDRDLDIAFELHDTRDFRTKFLGSAQLRRLARGNAAIDDPIVESRSNVCRFRA